MTQPTSAYHYATSGALRRSARRRATSRPVAGLSARLLPGLDHATYRLTRGRLVFSAWATELPVLLLTTKGARTGQPRTARVLGIPDGDGFVVVGANFGQRANPAWYHNLRAHPRVWVVAGMPRVPTTPASCSEPSGSAGSSGRCP
jgi:deazaflavin-dependent oxidoreductase (nitroreductase family)